MYLHLTYVCSLHLNCSVIKTTPHLIELNRFSVCVFTSPQSVVLPHHRHGVIVFIRRGQERDSLAEAQTALCAAVRHHARTLRTQKKKHYMKRWNLCWYHLTALVDSLSPPTPEKIWSYFLVLLIFRYKVFLYQVDDLRLVVRSSLYRMSMLYCTIQLKELIATFTFHLWHPCAVGALGGFDWYKFILWDSLKPFWQRKCHLQDTCWIHIHHWCVCIHTSVYTHH